MDGAAAGKCGLSYYNLADEDAKPHATDAALAAEITEKIQKKYMKIP